MADELIQIRGGRGYETADSLAARGEKAIAVEQLLRDLRINRIFEGSTEIMHLLIAREAVDQHLSVAGDIIDPDASLGRKAKAGGARRRCSTAAGCPRSRSARARSPAGTREYGALAKHVRFVERASRRLARETFYGDGPLAGQDGAQAGVPRPDRRHRRGAVRDVGLVVRATHGGPAGVPGARRPVLPPGSRCRVDALFDQLWDNTDADDGKLAGGYSTAATRSSKRACWRHRPTGSGWPPGSPGRAR